VHEAGEGEGGDGKGIYCEGDHGQGGEGEGGEGFFLTERIVYFLNTVHYYKIWKNTVIMKYKYIRRCVNLLLKRVIVG
jgi:hypothetical protein